MSQSSLSESNVVAGNNKDHGSEQQQLSNNKILNINVGVLGHVDSGKTSLCKAISTHASTAAFDKNPQSKERGITLDLGFSAFYTNSPIENFDKIQFTLVDCPGHASLIRTIIGGAQIIDMMVLVIDAIKGVQTQTAECIVIGEITCDKLIVVLNKIDLIPEEQRKDKIEKIKKSLIKNVFSQTKFKNPTILTICADPKENDEKLMIKESFNQLIDEFLNNVKEIYLQQREEEQLKKEKVEQPFLFMIDHCFAIKGKGTVLTGTVLQGKIEVGKTIQIPLLNEEKKVKSIQMFKQPVQQAIKGDRIGVLVTQFDSSKLERGFACDKGLIEVIDTVIASASKIRFFKKEVKGGSKYHISIGHETIMGVITFLIRNKKEGLSSDEFDSSVEYLTLEDLEDNTHETKDIFVKIDFEQPTTCYINSHYIASKLDTDINANTCRLAFHGKILKMWNKESMSKVQLSKILPVFKYKEKTAIVDRVLDETSLIGKNLLTKDSKKNQTIQPYIGKKVDIIINDESKYHGVIDSAFGQSGKFKVVFKEPLPKQPNLRNKIISLKYKLNIYDETKTWLQ
ncbi:hypothetical protein ABK040_006941 [Willaertia magna]